MSEEIPLWRNIPPSWVGLLLTTNTIGQMQHLILRDWNNTDYPVIYLPPYHLTQMRSSHILGFDHSVHLMLFRILPFEERQSHDVRVWALLNNGSFFDRSFIWQIRLRLFTKSPVITVIAKHTVGGAAGHTLTTRTHCAAEFFFHECKGHHSYFLMPQDTILLPNPAGVKLSRLTFHNCDYDHVSTMSV